MTTKRLIAAMLALFVHSLVLAADAGSVLFATGPVTAAREPAVALAKGDTVLTEDTITTGTAARAQLLMVDGAKIAIRPNSQLRIDDYVYAPAGSATSISKSDEASVISLVKGGFRTITGAIASDNKDNYEVRTAVGVLGVRGTNFAVLLCGGDCQFAPGAAPGDPVEDGLYIGVSSGSIVFRNPAGEIVVKAGEYAFIPMATRVPEKLDAPPAVLIDDNDLRIGADGSVQSPDTAGTATGFDARLGTRRRPDTSAPDPEDKDSNADGSKSAPEQPVIGIDADGTPVDITPGEPPAPTDGRTISYSTGPLGRGIAQFSGTQYDEPSQLLLDGNNNLLGFTGPYPGASGPDTAVFDIGTAANVDTGFDSVTVLRWGRWAGGTADGTLQSDGSDVSLDLGAQSLHWVSGPATAPPVMPITGTASYNLVGATSPTDSQGNTGVLGSATFNADFTNLRIDTTLDIDINGSNWNATGIGNIGAAANLADYLFSGTFTDVTITGAITGTGGGTFTGFFSEPGTTSDPAYPGGAGMTYSLQDGQGTTSVSGAAAFGNP